MPSSPSFNGNDGNVEENDSGAEDTIPFQDAEIESTKIQFRPEIEEIVNESSCIDANITNRSSTSIISSYPENTVCENYEEESNQQYTGIGTTNVNGIYRSDEINDSQASHQHRKTVELIENNDENSDGGTKYEAKPPKTFLSSHNTKNRRRKKLR